MSAGLRALPIFAAAVSLLIATGAYATTVEIDGSYSLSYDPSAGNAPKLTYKLGKTKNGIRTFTENLTPDDDATTPVNFFTAGPSAACGSDCVLNTEVTYSAKGKETDKTYPTASGTVTVAFAFDGLTVTNGDLSETGLYQAKYGGLPLSPCALASGPGKTDCITWDEGNDPLSISFTNGYTLDIFLNDAEDWAITPKISFQLTTTPVANPPETPLPATLTLFASGLAPVRFALPAAKKAAYSLGLAANIALSL